MAMWEALFQNHGKNSYIYSYIVSFIYIERHHMFIQPIGSSLALEAKRGHQTTLAKTVLRYLNKHRGFCLWYK